MRLKDYIDQQHSGSIRGFSISKGIERKQVYRYLNADCIWYDNRPYWPKPRGKNEQVT